MNDDEAMSTASAVKRTTSFPIKNNDDDVPPPASSSTSIKNDDNK